MNWKQSDWHEEIVLPERKRIRARLHSRNGGFDWDLWYGKTHVSGGYSEDYEIARAEAEREVRMYAGLQLSEQSQPGLSANISGSQKEMRTSIEEKTK